MLPIHKLDEDTASPGAASSLAYSASQLSLSPRKPLFPSDTIRTCVKQEVENIEQSINKLKQKHISAPLSSPTSSSHKIDFHASPPSSPPPCPSLLTTTVYESLQLIRSSFRSCKEGDVEDLEFFHSMFASFMEGKRSHDTSFILESIKKLRKFQAKIQSEVLQDSQEEKKILHAVNTIESSLRAALSAGKTHQSLQREPSNSLRQETATMPLKHLCELNAVIKIHADAQLKDHAALCERKCEKLEDLKSNLKGIQDTTNSYDRQRNIYIKKAKFLEKQADDYINDCQELSDRLKTTKRSFCKSIEDLKNMKKSIIVNSRHRSDSYVSLKSKLVDDAKAVRLEVKRLGELLQGLEASTDKDVKRMDRGRRRLVRLLDSILHFRILEKSSVQKKP